MDLLQELEQLKAQDEAPGFLDVEGFRTLKSGYLLDSETPKQMYRRVAKAAASYYIDNDKWEEKFFDVMWKNWLCPASPVLSNMGTERGLPISCNTVHVNDSIDSIFQKNYELAILSKNGAGVGIYFGDIRGRGVKIKNNGISEGIVPWAKVMDTTTVSVSQGSTRRGASAIYLPIDHLDVEEFINIRRPTGDINRRCLNTNHGVCVTDKWMEEMLAGDQQKRQVWQEILKTRVETGEPYLFFTDSVNRANPECYVKNNLSVKCSNICCLAGDTLVLTDGGYKRIDSLVDKTVNIWDGNQWVKNNSFKHRGMDELVRVFIKDGSFVDSNANHRWFVAKNYTDIRNDNYELKLTNELKIGDFIQYHDVEYYGKIEEKGAYLKGFLLGDGTSVDDRPILNLHSSKYMCEEALLNSAAELEIGKINTNVITKVSFSDEINYTNMYEGVYGTQKFKKMKGLSIRKEALYFWVSNARGGLPDDVINWTKKSKLEFLAGLFDSDGTILIKSSSIQFSAKSEKLIKDVQKLLRSMAIASGIDSMIKKDNSIIYRLSLSSFDSWKFLQEAPLKRIIYSGKKPNRKTTGWRKITKIEKLEGIHPVYCPVLPTTGKFALANGLMTGNTEITLHTDPEHSFVCCLSSLNLVRWNEWKDTDTVNVTVRFLDAVLSEYIIKAEKINGMEASRNSAIKGRAIGIGVLGWHTLLQENDLSFDSFDAMQLNAQIFKSIHAKANEETSMLAKELGEPEWCKGFNRRNTHLLAVAPTVSNSTISGGHSAGIEPISANIFIQKSAKGTFIRKNKTLEKLLITKNKNTTEVWKSINEEAGSVHHLDFLSDHEKEVFLTAREINQHTIIKLAAQRQRWIDQAQSVNLFFASNSSAKYIHEVHIAAWKSGLKTLYYFRSDGVIRSDLASRSEDDCKACEA